MNRYLISLLITLVFWMNIFAQEKEKTVGDTLFFKLDKSVLTQNDFEKDLYYFKENSTEEVFAFLIQKQNVKVDFKKYQVLNMNNYIEKLFEKKSRWFASDLSKELKKLRIFLVEKKDSEFNIIQVYPVTIIE